MNWNKQCATPRTNIKYILTLKLPSLFIKYSPKTLKWLPYILICHWTSLSTWYQEDIISAYSQCHVDSSACTEYNVNNQTLTQVQQFYVHIFFCLMVIRPWLNRPTHGHGHVICMGNLGGAFSCENTPEACTETHKSSFSSIKQVSGRNGDHEWLRMTNAFILCDLLWNVHTSHAVNREGSFNLHQARQFFYVRRHMKGFLFWADLYYGEAVWGSDKNLGFFNFLLIQSFNKLESCFERVQTNCHQLN